MTRPSRPLRIALVCDWYLPRVGGIETHVGDLARQLAAAGHRVDVITTRERTPVMAAAPEPDARAVRVRRLAIPLLPRVDIAFHPRTLGVLADALRDGAYDVVHCHASVVSPLAFAGAYLSQSLGLPCVVSHHSVLRRAGRVLSAVDRVLGWSRWPVLHGAVSPLVADELRAAAPEAEVRVLPNGVHPRAWMVPRRVPTGDGVVRVASVMRLAPRKRPQALVEIVARASARLPEGVRLHVAIAGDGPERHAVERAVRRHRLGDVVTLLGWQPREAVRALFAESDAFLLPSILESFGIAALEARCAGLPVLAMRRAGPAGFVRHGVEGLLADSDEDMATQLVRLATDDRLRAAIARHNRTTLPNETWEAVLARHESLYAEARQLARTRARQTGRIVALTPRTTPGRVAVARLAERVGLRARG